MALLEVLLVHAAQFVLVLLVLSFARPDSSIRPALIPVLVVLTLHILPKTLDAVSSKVQASFIATNVIGVFLQYIDFGLISKWSFLSYDLPPADENPNQAHLNPAVWNIKLQSYHRGAWRRLQWGLFATTVWRAPATAWEVKGTPRFDPVQPTFIPSRPRFLLDTFKTLVSCWAILDLMSLIPPQSAEARIETFAWNRVPLFSRWTEVSAEEVTTRLLSTFLFWLATYCILQVFYCSVAIIGVSTRLTRVEAWPPLFGPVTECYSVRRFWGVFWHQALRRKVGRPASYITYSWLGCRRGSLAGRYICVLLTFAVSGLFHLAEEYTAGVPLHRSGAMRFYCTQTLGLLLEDATQAVLPYLVGDDSKSRTRQAKVLGYLWIALWMTWTSPAWIYPKQLCNRGTSKDQVLPFSLTQRLISIGWESMAWDTLKALPAQT
ncbi:membrane bound O-acyl transferase family-domain-containing protein [Biscogniauxia mediterranea]|nr:membrane bound O-acyl transferase family-domain-containing protein [Biscogniauxia mediterranea]